MTDADVPDDKAVGDKNGFATPVRKQPTRSCMCGWLDDHCAEMLKQAWDLGDTNAGVMRLNFGTPGHTAARRVFYPPAE
jgi:hypothetical protein